MAKSLTIGYTSKVDEYQRTLKNLKEDFRGEVAIVTEIVVYQILAKTDEILQEVKDMSMNMFLIQCTWTCSY
jgi:hypothetical protein